MCKIAVAKTTFGAQNKFVESKIEGEILSYSTVSHRDALRMAEQDFRRSMASFPSKAIVFLTGSFAAGVDMYSADLDFTVNVPEWVESKEEKARKLMKIKEFFMGSPLFHGLWVVRAKVSF